MIFFYLLPPLSAKCTGWLHNWSTVYLDFPSLHSFLHNICGLEAPNFKPANFKPFTFLEVAPIQSSLQFDVDDVSGELDSNRPVPFRLTPNVYEFISEVGVRGPLTASMISAARCLVHPNFKVQAILRYVRRDLGENCPNTLEDNSDITSDCAL